MEKHIFQMYSYTCCLMLPLHKYKITPTSSLPLPHCHTFTDFGSMCDGPEHLLWGHAGGLHLPCPANPPSGPPLLPECFSPGYQ